VQKYEPHRLSASSMNLIRKYFPELTPLQITQLEKLEELYLSWNKKINVISRKDINHLYERHILHSLAIAKAFSFSTDTTILDVGTGGGFPGIPLAIYFPSCSFTLIDSAGKKIIVVQSICDALELKNTKSIHIRVEQYDEKFNFVVARAITDMHTFIKWVSKNIDEKQVTSRKNGIIYLKGGDFQEELTSLTSAQVIHISQFFKEDFFQTKKIIYIPF
jgi:16S rRNA (guanine527-N7)-methyltransferase